MEVLIIGGSGLVGSHPLSHARNIGLAAAGTFRGHPQPSLLFCDTSNSESFRKLLGDHSPKTVIYSAGFTWVDGCEKDPLRSHRENIDFPLACAAECSRRGIRFVLLSTSYVFDGSQAHNSEECETSPVNVYGRHKATAEYEVARIFSGTALIIRVVWVWGVETQRKNFVYQVARAILSGGQMAVPSDQWGNPTWAGDIARWLFALLAAGHQGIWHLASDDFCSRVDWLRSIQDYFVEYKGWSLSRAAFAISPTSTLGCAPRPLLGGLSCEKLHKLGLGVGVSRLALRDVFKQEALWG